jgi:hypothetical protein
MSAVESVNSRLLLLGLLTCGSLAVGYKASLWGEGVTHRRAAPCARGPARTFAPGEVTVVEGTNAPCTLIFQVVGPRLRASLARGVEGIGPFVSRDRTGRFYTNWRERITVWDATGEPIATFGSLGRGPGEFSFDAKMTYHDADNVLYVRERSTWSSFSPNQRFIATIEVPGTGSVDDEASAFLDDGRFLVAGARGQNRDSYFTVYRVKGLQQSDARSLAASAVTSFGDVPPAERSLPSDARQRAIGYAGGNTFWAGPPFRGQSGYDLELWSVNGHRLRTIRRITPWFPRNRRTQSATDLPEAAVTSLRADSTGLLLVGVAVPVAGKARTKELDDFLTIYLEVLDIEAGTVLASLGPLRYSRATQEMPTNGFPGSRVGYRVAEGTDGDLFVQLVEYVVGAREP